MALPEVMHRYKSLTSARYRKALARNNALSFSGRLWQRNYYDHIIRDGAQLDRIRRYIHDNPLRWEFDCENPAAQIAEDARPWE